MKEPISREEAVALISDGATLMIGGFVGVGTPDQLLQPESAWGLHSSTKLDRDRKHMGDLHDEGREVTREWLAGWQQHGEDFARYPEYPKNVELSCVNA